MTNHPFIFFFFSLILLLSCRANKYSANQIKKFKDISLLAWNEDTVHNYQFAITSSNHFFYTILKNDSLKSEAYFNGTIVNQPSFDTIFLKYHKNIKPVGATNYLIREISGGYLVQPFENSEKRIFMRIQRFPHRY